MQSTTRSKLAVDCLEDVQSSSLSATSTSAPTAVLDVSQEHIIASPEPRAIQDSTHEACLRGKAHFSHVFSSGLADERSECQSETTPGRGRTFQGRTPGTKDCTTLALSTLQGRRPTTQRIICLSSYEIIKQGRAAGFMDCQGLAGHCCIDTTMCVQLDTSNMRLYCMKRTIHSTLQPLFLPMPWQASPGPSGLGPQCTLTMLVSCM